jgi:hypothetical protein
VYFLIYKTTNKIDGKTYIGKHQTNNLNDGYIGSGIHLVRAIKKFGRDNFTREILYTCASEDEMNLKEKELITEDFLKRKDVYNIGMGGEGGAHFKGKKKSAASIRKAIETRKKNGWYVSEETRKKISESNSRRLITNEFRKKMSDIAKKRFKTLEERRKISETLKSRNKQHTVSEETRKKMSESARNRRK